MNKRYSQADGIEKESVFFFVRTTSVYLVQTIEDSHAAVL
jgi:hypothetical protein